MATATPQYGKSVVVGGSIAGLLTARVLSDFFDEVTVIDRDGLPQTAVPRRGVPQSVQPHVLFTRGYRILEALFPGIGKDLSAAGAVAIDWGQEFHYFHQGSRNATSEEASGLVSFTCTRPLLEATVRKRVAQRPNIQWQPHSRVKGLMGDLQQVSGVVYQDSADHLEKVLSADLVLDASGRSSKAAEWLQALGLAAPAATRITPHLGYATQRLQIPEGCSTDWKVLLVSQEAPHNPRLGYLAQVENNEWIATLGGYGKDYPPLEQAPFMEFARSLASPAFYEAIRDAQPVTQIKAHRATANRLYHYETLAMPRGFAAIGDAVCALCPVYGQGMTVSAISAMTLQKWLQQSSAVGHLDTSAFQQKLANCLQFPWGLATGSDAQFPTTEGGAASPNPVAKLFQGYIQRLLKKSKQDGWVHVRFTEVAHMVKPPTAFFAPRLLLKALSR